MPRQTKHGAALIPLLFLLPGCHVVPDIRAQDAQAHRLLAALDHAPPASVQTVYAAGTDDLRRYQSLPQFARAIAALDRRVGHVRAVTRTDFRVTRTMSEEKTSLIYHLTGDQGQADVKLYLAHRQNQWLLDDIRTN